MRADLRRRLEMAVRVRDFFRTHQTDGATQEGAVARLEQLVQRAELLASQQRAGVIATASLGSSPPVPLSLRQSGDEGMVERCPRDS